MSLRRRQTKHPIRTRVLVVCEGKLEASYFNAMNRHENVRSHFQLDVRCAYGGRHAKVLETAVNLFDSGRVAHHAVTWCIFDTETGQEASQLKRTLDKCKQHGFQVGLSNPCFNIWALAHVKELDAGPTTAEKSLREMKDAFGGKLNVTDMDWVCNRIMGGENFSRVEAAMDRVKCIPPDENSRVIQSNPSTSVAALVRSLMGS